MTGARPVAIFDATPLALGERTGVARFARELLERFARDRSGPLDWIVAAPRPIPGGPEALAAGDGRLSPFSWRRTALRRLAEERSAAALFSPFAAIPFGRLACPAIATVHDVPWARRGEVPKEDVSFRKRLSLGYTASRAARIVVPSEATRRDLVSLFPRAAAKTRVVPLGVSAAFRAAPLPPEERRRARRRLSIPDGPFLLALGALRARKNPGFLLDVLAAGHFGAHERLSLVVTGEGSVDPDALRERATERGLAGRAVFTGHVSDPDLATLLDEALAVAVPSAIEGFSLPAAEAMARGTPVLAAERGALPEVVGDAGFVLPHGAAAPWAAAVRTLLAEPGRRDALGAKGRARAAAFDWDATAREVAALVAEAAFP